jgi:alkanesulfonate monooxygenase SsuD/methylene tetrahydromethanopterin reductase-like flavin-dependent oxidoreductase (luciferase family)
MGTPEYLRWLADQVEVGRGRAEVAREHSVTTFALYRVDHDGAAAKRAVRDVLAFYLFVAPDTPLTEVYGIGDELRDMHARGGDDALALITREMPDKWVDDLTVAGTPDECAERLGALYDAGSESVCVWPSPAEGVAEVLRLTADEVLPRLR